MATSPAAWTDLGGSIRVRQSEAYRMNSGLMLDPQHAILVDPGVLPSELDDIARAVNTVRPAEITLVLTHAHWDHVLGRAWWPKARVVAHDAFAAELARDRDRIEAEALRLASEHGERWRAAFAPFAPDLAVSGLHFAKFGNWRVVFRDAFGHSESQLSLHLPEPRVLFAADMLSDIEMPMLNGPVAAYRRTLEALRPLVAHGAIETLVPGHGAIAHGTGAVEARLTRDLAYLDALESGTREALAQGLTLEQARERLAAMEYTGKHSSEYPTLEFHLENIRIAYQHAATAGKPESRTR